MECCIYVRCFPSNRPRGVFHYAGLGYVEAAQEPLKPAGRVTLLLTAPVQPFEQDTASFLEELLQALGIAPDAIIVPIASIFADQGFHCIRQLLMPALPYPFGESGYAFAQPFARRAALHQRSASTTESPIKLETQEVKASVVRSSTAPKTQHLRFIWGHLQPELAQRFLGQLQKRLNKFGLEVAPDKTQMLRFGRGGGPHNGRFDFLGFEFYWRLSRRGRPLVQRRTARKRLRKSVTAFTEWIRQSRHEKWPDTMKTLVSKYRGYWNYYGVRGNSKSLEQFFQETRRILFKWLNRRSQKKSYTARGFERFLRRFHIPQPRLVEHTPVPIRREATDVNTALHGLFRRYNHSLSRA